MFCHLHYLSTGAFSMNPRKLERVRHPRPCFPRSFGPSSMGVGLLLVVPLFSGEEAESKTLKPSPNNKGHVQHLGGHLG